MQCKTQLGHICSRTFFPRCLLRGRPSRRFNLPSSASRLSFCFVFWLLTKYQLCPSPPNGGWASPHEQSKLYAEKEEEIGKPSGVYQLSVTAALMSPPEDQNDYKVYEIVKHIKIPEVETGNKTHKFSTQRHQSPALTAHFLPSARRRQAWLLGKQAAWAAHTQSSERGRLVTCWWTGLVCIMKTGSPDTDKISQKALKRETGFCSLWYTFHTFNGKAARFKETFSFKCAITE